MKCVKKGGGGFEARGCSHPCSRLPTPDLICPLTPPSCWGNPIQVHRGGWRVGRNHTCSSTAVKGSEFWTCGPVPLHSAVTSDPNNADTSGTKARSKSVHIFPISARHRQICLGCYGLSIFRYAWHGYVRLDSFIYSYNESEEIFEQFYGITDKWWGFLSSAY